MAEARDMKGVSPASLEEFEIIIRRYNIFQESEYLNEAYDLFGT